MLLEVQDLIDVAEALKSEIGDDVLNYVLFRMNNSGRLYEFMDSIGYSHLLPSGVAPSCVDGDSASGKIIVVGESEVKRNVLLAVANSLGFNKNRFEMNLEYYDGERYDFSKTRHKSKYALIMFGPVPHSGVSKENASSVISNLKTPGAGYPPVIELGSNGLKITKSNFAEALENEVSMGYITRDAA